MGYLQRSTAGLSMAGVFALSAAGISAADTVELDWYGFIKADAIYDTDALNGLLGTSVDQDAGEPGKDGTFNITANQTRFGVNLKGPENDQYALSGKLRMDFYGDSTAKSYEGNTQPNPRMRHAYGKITFKEYGVDLLAGQTSEIVSPLVSSVNSFGASWKVGNVGFRFHRFVSPKNTAVATLIGSLISGWWTLRRRWRQIMQLHQRCRHALVVLSSFLTDKKTTIGISGSYGSETRI